MRALVVAFAVVLGACEAIAGVRHLAPPPPGGTGGVGATAGTGGATVAGSGGNGVCPDANPIDLPPCSGTGGVGAACASIYTSATYQVGQLLVTGSTLVWSSMLPSDDIAGFVLTRDIAAPAPAAGGACPETTCLSNPDEHPTAFALDGNGELYWAGETVACIKHKHLGASGPSYDVIGGDASGRCDTAATRPMSGGNRIVIDDARVYAILEPDLSGRSGATVVSYDRFTFGPQAPMALSTTNETGALGLAVDDTYVYWGMCDAACMEGKGPGSVKRSPKAGGSTGEIFGASSARPNELLLADGYLYWLSGDWGGQAGGISRKATGAAAADPTETVYSSNIASNGSVNRMIADDRYLYWIDGSAIWRGPKGPHIQFNDAETVVPHTTNVFDLALGCAGLYWTDQDGNLLRIPRP